MVKSFFSALFILYVSVLFAQNTKNDSAHPLKPIGCDCKKAVKITVGWNSKYGPTMDTKGFGDIEEIPVKDKHSKYYFEAEHNSAWYLLKMNADGELVFDIVPVDPKNDYDFLLFKYRDSGFCRNFLERKLIPVRSNISRVSDEDSGKTGLSIKAKVEYETRGKGFSYSKSIHVKKDEQYMLVLDNVNDSGRGHTILFHILKEFNISGKTLDDDSMPIAADVTITAKNGTVLAKTESDKTTGEYNLTVPLQMVTQYNLICNTQNSFFDINPFFTGLKQKDTIRYKPVILPKLIAGKKYKLKNILFEPGLAVPLEESYVTMGVLYTILTNHKNMTIIIEGHVNSPGDSTSNVAWNLSVERAKTVYNYLISKGINRERLKTMGFGGRHPIYFNPKDWNEEEQNRRVEIRIISLGE